MPKISTEEFKYYKSIIEKDISKHNEELDKYNRPEEVIEAYKGRFKDSEDEGMVENYLFIGATTILPSLFFQMPRINVRAKRDNLRFEAAVLTSLTNVSFGDKEKEENQLCIIDAFLPYGYAVMKNGYNSRTGKAIKPSMLTGEAKSDKTNDMEGDVEYIQYEKAISIRQSPKKTYLDSTQPFGKGNRITFEYSRTLQQLIDSNLYNLSSNFISHYSARNTDKRLIDITIFEHWCMIQGYAWKLVYTDGWDEELQWVKTEYKGLPVSYLRFNKIGDTLYGISHGTLALRSQKELNYLNELWKKHIDNIRNQYIVWMEGLTESGKKTLRANDFGGIVESRNRLTEGIAMPITSALTDPNLFNNISNVREYLKLILSTTGGKLGGPESELATIEKNKAIGDALRSSNMQDAIRDFMIDQVKQRIVNFLRFGTPDIIVKMTGENIFDPLTGQSIPSGTELRLGSQEGAFSLKDLISGDIDIDFIFEVDMQSATRPDFPVIRKQIAEGISLGIEAEPSLNQKGKTFNLDMALEDYFSTFDAIPNAKKYITDMTDEAKNKLINTIASSSKGGVPSEEAIVAGAEKVVPATGVGVQ